MYNKAGQIVDRREQLKVKFNSLMDEARVIRRAEKKVFGPLREELHLHRKGVVRDEARSSSLALGFIRVKTLEQMEVKSQVPPNWSRIRRLLHKYGAKGIVDLNKTGPITKDEQNFYKANVVDKNFELPKEFPVVVPPKVIALSKANFSSGLKAFIKDLLSSP